MYLFNDFYCFSSCLYKYALVKLWRLWKRKTQKKRSEPKPEPKEWKTHPMQLFRIIRQDKKRVSGLLFAVFKYDCVDDVRTYGATLVRLAGLSIQADGGEIQLDGWINTKVDMEAQKVKTFCRDFYRDYYWKFCTQQNIDGDDVRAMLHPRRLAICGAPVGVDAAAATEATIAATTTDAAADTVADATIAAVTSDATTAVTDTATEATIAAAILLMLPLLLLILLLLIRLMLLLLLSPPLLPPMLLQLLPLLLQTHHCTFYLVATKALMCHTCGQRV